MCVLIYLFTLKYAALQVVVQPVHVCGFPPSFSQKEKSHIHSLTRPGRRSIATSWQPVWSKVNIWREATVQAGTRGLEVAQLCCSLALPLYLSIAIPPSYMAVSHRARDCRGCCFWIGLSEMFRLMGPALYKESASLAWLVSACLLSSGRPRPT